MIVRRGESKKRVGVIPKRRGRPGTPPGAFTPDPEAPRPVIHVLSYSSEGTGEATLDDPSTLSQWLHRNAVTWVNVSGLGDPESLAKVGEVFGLHPLALEDVVHAHQRPKVEPYPASLFIVLRAAVAKPDSIATEQVSLFLGRDFVLTFEERPGPLLDTARERIRQGLGRIRSAGADYLAYTLIDTIVDHYFPVAEQQGERLERLEDEVLSSNDSSLVGRIHDMRHDVLTLRRIVWPLREALAAVQRDGTELVSDETRMYLRDCYDHCVQLLDLIESYREGTSWLMEAYLTGIDIRTNEVMKVLTVIATIFIPLTFIAGVYGMNFDPSVSPFSMPELRWYWGYPLALALMAVVALGLLYYFRRRGWL